MAANVAAADRATAQINIAKDVTALIGAQAASGGGLGIRSREKLFVV